MSKSAVFPLVDIKNKKLQYFAVFVYMTMVLRVTENTTFENDSKGETF